MKSAYGTNVNSSEICVIYITRVKRCLTKTMLVAIGVVKKALKMIKIQHLQPTTICVAILNAKTHI